MEPLHARDLIDSARFALHPPGCAQVPLAPQASHPQIQCLSATSRCACGGLRSASAVRRPADTTADSPAAAAVRVLGLLADPPPATLPPAGMEHRTMLLLALAACLALGASGELTGRLLHVSSRAGNLLQQPGHGCSAWKGLACSPRPALILHTPPPATTSVAAQLPTALKNEGGPPFLDVGVVRVSDQETGYSVYAGAYTKGVRTLVSVAPDGTLLTTTGAWQWVRACRLAVNVDALWCALLREAELSHPPHPTPLLPSRHLQEL